MYADFPWVTILIAIFAIYSFIKKLKQPQNADSEDYNPNTPTTSQTTTTQPRREFSPNPAPTTSNDKTPMNGSFEQILEQIRQNQRKPFVEETMREVAPTRQVLNTDTKNTELEILLETQRQRREITMLNNQTEQGMNRQEAESANYEAYRPRIARVQHPVKQLLSTKQGLRQAILAAEILKPKYI